MRILFVCSGNICRSPYAEALARELNEGIGVEFASAGTIAIDGNPATPAGVDAAAADGIDMTRHRAARLTHDVLDGCDVAYAMEHEHLRSVLDLDPQAVASLLRSDGEAIPDPYGGGPVAYRDCYSRIRVAIEERRRQGTLVPGAGP